MTIRKWLTFDCNALAWAAFHTTGGLQYNGTPTGVVYGFLAAVLRIQGELGSNDTVFCFDFGKSHRYSLLPSYKCGRKKRREASEREQAIYAEVHKQITLLRTRYLKEIGFRNVFYQKHYEADDLIAAVCDAIPEEESMVIVSSDKDMYQLLRKNVHIYNPTAKQLMTRAQFKRTYGLKPRDWVKVKCLAGCSSDDVPGIRGVGEATAIKYLKGELKTTSKAYEKIKTGLREGILTTNRPLVRLPYEGVRTIQLRRDRKLSFDSVFQECNFKTLDPDIAYCEKD